MSRDRIAYWAKSRPPNPLEWMRDSVRSYLDGACVKIAIGPEGAEPATTVFATIVGEFSDVCDEKSYRSTSERWFEVWCGEDSIDVLTRRQDEFTNAVADGFFEAIVRIWGMTREEDLA